MSCTVLPYLPNLCNLNGLVLPLGGPLMLVSTVGLGSASTVRATFWQLKQYYSTLSHNACGHTA